MGTRCRFVTPDKVRLQLADVHRRAHTALLAKELPAKATAKDKAARAEAIARSAARLKQAEEDADYIDVRKRLTAGEQRARYTRMSEVQADGTLRTKRLELGLSTIIAYLLDWSLTDQAGKPFSIRGLAPDELGMSLDTLEPEAFDEILQAINYHEDAEASAREAPFGESASLPT